jgi:hypothetical protein
MAAGTGFSSDSEQAMWFGYIDFRVPPLIQQMSLKQTDIDGFPEAGSARDSQLLASPI